MCNLDGFSSAKTARILMSAHHQLCPGALAAGVLISCTVLSAEDLRMIWPSDCNHPAAAAPLTNLTSSKETQFALAGRER